MTPEAPTWFPAVPPTQRSAPPKSQIPAITLAKSREMMAVIEPRMSQLTELLIRCIQPPCSSGMNRIPSSPEKERGSSPSSPLSQ